MKKCIYLILLCGCTLYPKYERPTIGEESVAWRFPLNTENSVDVGWWKQFGDEVLDQLIDQALANNQDLQVAMARVDQFRASLTVAESRLYPQINADVSAERLQKPAAGVDFHPKRKLPMWSLFTTLFNASYFVDLWGEVRSGVEAARHDWISSIEARRVVVLGLVSSVASAYIDLRKLDEQLQISQETLALRKEALYLAKVQFETGYSSKMEVEQALTAMQDVEIQIENFEIDIAQTEDLLSVLLGAPSQNIPRGLPLEKAHMPLSIPPISPLALLNQRPDIRVAEEKLMAANANIGVARALFFPQLNITSDLGSEALRTSVLFSKVAKTWMVTADAMQQIFTGFRLTGNLKLTYAEKEELIHAYLSTILTAFQDVNDALIAHKIYLEQVEVERRRVAELKEYLFLANLQYQEGEVDYLNFIDAERQLFTGQLSFEQALSNSYLSYVQIYQALGGGWVNDADCQALETKSDY